MVVLYTTHYLEEAQSLCSRVGVMDEGKIIAEGAPEELIRSRAGCGSLGDLFLRLTGKRLRD